jgi:hypothetical protein
LSGRYAACDAGGTTEASGDRVGVETRPRLEIAASVGEAKVVLNLNLSGADLDSDEGVDALAARVKRLLDAVSGAALRADAD